MLFKYVHSNSSFADNLHPNNTLPISVHKNENKSKCPVNLFCSERFHIYLSHFNPYDAGTESGESLSPV